LLVFMARILASTETTRIRGVGVDEKTALLVEPDGKSRVVGKGEVDFFEATRKPEVCQPSKPLSFAGVRLERVSHGGVFDVKTWHGNDRIYSVTVLSESGKPVTATTPGVFDHLPAE